MTHPDRDLADVNPHLDALFTIANAGKTNPEALDRQLHGFTALYSPEQRQAIMRYLACYAASLLRRLREHQALPSDPADYLDDITSLVAATVPRPE
ncbi:MAG: hypothetical protein ACRDOU_05425 [Streptosporangiaceae bacterium]